MRNDLSVASVGACPDAGRDRRLGDQRSPLQRTALRLLIAFLLLTASARATTVTGTIVDAKGAAVASGKIIFRLSQETTDPGPRLVITQPPVTCTVTAGQIVATCTVIGNDTLSPALTFYFVRIVSAGGLTLLPERKYTIDGAAWVISEHTPLATAPVAAQAYQIVADEGTSRTQRQIVNFKGTGVSCVDNATNARTDCTISSTGINFVDEEGPAGQINGSNVTFTLAHAPSPATSLKLVYNGATLRSGAGNDFTLSTNTITMLYAPTAGSNLICWYQY
jgi:hypothetical protein